MPEPTLQELLRQYQEEAQPSEKHQALLQALQAYDTQTAAFRQLRGRKKLPLVTARDKTNLMALHKAIGSTADALLKDNDEPEALREIVKKITALSSASYNALLQYDPAKEPKTLSSLEEDVRTLTLHLGKTELGDRLSGAQSERSPLSFLDGKGNRVSGVFTKKKVLDAEQQFRDAIKSLTDSFSFRFRNDGPAVAWLRDNFCEKARSVSLIAGNLGQNAEAGEYIANLLQNCLTAGSNGEIRISASRLKAYAGAVLEAGGFSADSISDSSWRQLAENMKPMINPVLVGHGAAKIPFGGRFDTRNSAMSAVADLLGMPNVIARSKPMKIIDQDGAVIEGTFMEGAKGMDPNNLPPKAAELKADCMENTNGQGFKDLANLQILDYLCGNHDRHNENMLYQFDKNGKLCGVQGIDNDSALGVLTNKQIGKANKNYKWMTNIGNMKVIPEDTCKRIEALDESTLKYALRGYGLTEPELNAAGLRLKNLKTAIQKSREQVSERKKPLLRIMSDSAFKGCTMASLQDGPQYDFENGKGNHFNLAAEMIVTLPNRCKKQEQEYRDLKNATAVGMDNRAERHVPGKERVKGSAIEALLKKRTWWGFSSDNYVRMQDAAREYIRCYKAVETRLDEANKEENKRSANYRHEKDAVVSEADLERMRDASVRMRDAAVTYLTGKIPNFDPDDLDEENFRVRYPDGASDYTKRRIDVAIDALKLARQGCEIKPVERQTAQDNLREAEAAQQRRQAERSPQPIASEKVVPTI